jgi:hypothetical protein
VLTCLLGYGIVASQAYPRAIQSSYNSVISRRGAYVGDRGSVMTEMEFCLLGPVMVRSSGVDVPFPGEN